MSEVRRWQRADDLAQRWDALWDVLDDALWLIQETDREAGLREPVWKFEDVEEAEKQATRLLDIAAEQTERWEKIAATRGSEILSQTRPDKV